MSRGWEDVAGEFLQFISEGDPGFDWHSEQFLELVPADARSVLDDGCGEGRLARMLAARGHAVTAVDGSPTLVRHAREADPNGTYGVADVRSLPFEDESFDCVVSFMVLQDVDDHTAAIREAARVLRPGGALCIAIVHPLSSAGDWASDDAESDFLVANYCGAFSLTRPLGERTVTQYHRPIDDYVRVLHGVGFALEELRELPTRRRAAGRIPVFLDLRARKG